MMHKFENKMVSRIILFLALFQTCLANKTINKYFDKINNETKHFNEIAAEIAWESTIDPGNTNLPEKAADYQKKRIVWQHENCDKMEALQFHERLNKSQDRQTYLLCRGLKYSYNEAREFSRIYAEMQSIYSDTEICIPGADLDSNHLEKVEVAIWKHVLDCQENLKQGSTTLKTNYGFKSGSGACLTEEREVEKIMRFSKNEEVLRWLWMAWRERTKPMWERYHKLTYIQNKAAVRNGYPNAGDVWRDEVEIPNIDEYCRQLYNHVEPLYKLLHGVVRFFLRREYGEIVPKRGLIPAHLLGSLWAHNWEPLAELILFEFNRKTIDLNKEIKKAKIKWTVKHMIKRAEDFYISLGLPAMTDEFWRESVFSRENHTEARCHGAAADMFKDGDFRLIYCSEVSIEDFYVLHHEMGHIQYYMAYEKQPAIFRQANSALHESIGDAIMLGVMTPQHLYRLGLIDDALLYPNNNLNPQIDELSLDDDKEEHVRNVTKEIQKPVGRNKDMEVTSDDVFLLQQGLSKLPHIPFALVMDEYRWKYFEERIDKDVVNEEFWTMVGKLQGVAPPEPRSEEYFDLGAKFHVPDNTPYIRYFLSSFLQHQLFENLCKAAVYGRRDVHEPIPKTIIINRCDIYGSKSAGKILRDIMTRGNSQHWRDILGSTTGNTDISAEALKRYYRPLYKLLTRLVRKYEIPIGW